MAMSRERKIFTAVLLVAGAALAIDRGFLGITGAKAAHADELPLAAKAAEAKPVIPTVTLAGRLKQFADVEKNVDLLEVTLQHPQAQPEVPQHAATPVIEDQRPDFVAQHHLSAISTTARGANAIINGRAVAVGEELAGFRLVEVTRDGAFFEGPGGSVELHLPKAR